MSDAEPIIRPNFAGTPAVRGTRLNIFHIMDHYLTGRAAAWVAEFYEISVADADAAYAYIAQHEADLKPRYDAIINRVERERRDTSPELEASFARSHEKLLRLKAELDRRQAEEGAPGNDARVAG